MISMCINVSGQASSVQGKTLLSYDLAVIDSITPYCGSEYDRNSNTYKEIECMRDMFSNNDKNIGFETDGCSVTTVCPDTDTNPFIVKSSSTLKLCKGKSMWEDYTSWQARINLLPNSEKGLFKNQRRCGPTASDVRWQMLVIKGKNFASSENAPAKFISITAKRRKCDCPRNQPCMNTNTYICSAVMSIRNYYG